MEGELKKNSGRWKPLMVNLGVLFLSLLVTYGLFEGLLRLNIDRLPPHVYNLFARELKTIGQSSKSGLVPTKPYIAIVGDSYGEGRGDWFDQNGRDRSSKFQAAHLLHDSLGMDVVSFSRAGAGNYDGMAIYAINTFKTLRNLGFNLAAPEYVLAYFYEGNDISDNLNFYERYYEPDYDPNRLYDDEYFNHFAEQIEQEHCSGTFREFEGNFILAKGIGSAFESLARSVKGPEKEARELDSDFLVQMNGERVPLYSGIQAFDVLSYSEDEVRCAVRFFERALVQVRKFWPKAKFLTVYIPSPLSSYHAEEKEAAKRLKRSREIAALIEDSASENGASFVNSLDAIRQQTNKRYLHGPADWSHFNRNGYEVFAGVLESALRKQVIEKNIRLADY